MHNLRASAIAAACAFALSFASLPGYAQNKGPRSVPIEQLATAEDPAAVFATQRLAPILKGVNKVAVPIFTLETVQKTGKGVRRESASGSVTQSVTYLLSGVPEAQVQAAVNEMYDAFVADLAAKGIAVVPVPDVLATAAHRKLVADGKNAASGPLKVSKGEVEVEIYSARGLATGSASRYMYFDSLSGGASAGGGVLGALGSLTQVANLVADGNSAAEIGAELAVPLLTVQIPLDFVEQSTASSGGFLSGVTSASVSSELRLSISSAAHLSAWAPGGASVSLPVKAPLILGGTPVKEVRDTSSVAANVGLAVFAAAIGSKSSNRMTEKTAVVDPDRFMASLREGLSQYRQMLVRAVVALQ